MLAVTITFQVSSTVRRMLFEPDTSIQKLTLDKVDESALLQLTGLYHNLLRSWSET